MKSIIETWNLNNQLIFSQNFIYNHRKRAQDFTRNSKLSFGKVMTFLMKAAKKSLQIECNLLADIEDTEPVTKQAMSHARTKINISAFQELHYNMIKAHYQDNPHNLWKGYRVFGGDGSTVQLSKQMDIPKIFGDSFKHLSLGRIFQYVELTTDTLVSPNIMPYWVSEQKTAKLMLSDLVKKMRSFNQDKQLYVYDRGFPSHHFAIQHLELKVDFLFRIPKRFNPIIDKVIERSEEADFLLDIDRIDAKYRARVIVRYLSSGAPLILLTSLKSDEFSADDVVEAYQMRWRNEENYKFQKLLLQLENFSGKTAQSVIQDYWSNAYIATTMNLLFLEKDKEIQNESGDVDTSINKSVVYASLRADFVEAMLTCDTSDKIFIKFDKYCRRYRIPKRPGRSYPRLSDDTRRRRHIYRKCL